SYVEEENNGVVAQGKVGPISMDIINGLTGTKEILSWNLGADLSREFPNTMNAISQYFTDYTLTTTVETDPEILSSLLADKEVFLIPEQEIGGSSTFYTSLATLWAPVLNDFVNNGGSIIMCGTWSGTGVFEIFNNSGLISLGQGSISFGQDMIVEDMPHYLTEGLGDVVVSQDATYLLELQDSDALELVTYQGDAAVIVKEIGSGNVTYIAYDYFDYDDDAARIISNAVANAGSQGTAEWITIDAFSGTIPAGTSQNIEVNLDATTLVSGLYQATVQITSDNLTTPELNVPVALEVTNGPGVFINPDSITTTLVVGQVTDEVLTIDNSAGVFDVQWEANIGDYVASPSLSKTALYLENEHLTSFSSTENNGMMGMGKVAPISMEVINGMDGNKRILAWNLYTDTFGEFPNTMNAISQYFTDYTLTTTIETDPDALSTLLVDQDILLIPEKETGGNQSFYANLASSWGPTLDDFVRSGGTIIMCGSSSGFGVYELFNSSNLMSMSPASRINSGDLVVDDTAHYLTEGLGETFGAENATFLIDLQDSDALQLASYQGDAAVAVKEIGSGAVVYIAYDYYAYNDEAARLIANAVANAGAGTNWLTIDSLSGTIPAGSSQNIVGTLDATQLSTGTYSANIRITSDNLTTPELEVPVELEVIQGIGLEVDPSSFEESVDKGGTVVRTMTLDNSEGVVDVSWQANIAPRQGFETEASGTVKVLVWDRFIRYGILDRINDAISLHFNDFTITTTSEESPDSLGGLLNTHDVFIIAEQRSGNASYYNDLGNSWAPELQKFVRRGGTIVQNSWRYSTHEILAAAELLEFTGVYSSYSGKVTKSQFKLGHYLLQGVATFNPIEFVAPVVTTDDPEAQILMMENKHRAAFLTKDVSHGRVIYIGLTYYYGFTNSTARILANSISTSRRNASWLTLNQTSGVVAAGSIREVDVVIDGSDLFGGEYKADIVLESDALASSMLNIPVDLTVNESIEPLVVESTCTDNPDSLRAWTITNTNGFDRRAFWFIVGTSLADSITLHPSENVLEIPTQTSVPNTLKLRWLDKDGNQQEVTVESTAGPCRVRGLILNPVCSTNPELFLRWEVENRSPFDVQFVWEIEGTDISGTVNATPGISEFFTEATGGDQYVKITWYDEEGNPRRQKKLSIDNACRVRGLILNPVCSTNPEVERRWELVNRNAFSVEVKMEDLSLKTTTFITALPGNSYFTTPYSEGELDVKITWIDEEGNPRRQQKTASAEECYNEFAGGQNTDTQDDDEQDVVVDVLNETVRTYPNPFSDRINLTMNVEPDAEGMFSILIYNVLGNMVYQGEVETSFGAIKTHINTADFSKGTYLMTIVSENNQFRETRILIKGQ
ncbi:MAG: T9SS type A sorting domain-containing protein, partial [Bacteroidota bacterium]